MADYTCDPILRGRLRLWQPRRGYRLSVDSLLLVDFARPRGGRPPRRLIDLCAGGGVIGLGLAVALPRAEVVLAELQPEMVALAQRNVDENRLGERVQIVAVDLGDGAAARRLLPGASFDLVAASPPFFRLQEGPTVDDEGEALARHELRMTLGDLAREAKRLLVPGGRATVVFPSQRLVELLAELATRGLQPTRLRLVHPRPGAAAQRALVEAVKGGKGGLLVDPPLYLRDHQGDYSVEAKGALGEA